jgi:RNA polymerase sigma-70 factor (ECF subfamily)
VTEVAVSDVPGNADVVREAARGDEAAFARLIGAHNEAMARVAFVIAGDREQTLDAVQSAWEIAWRRLGSLRDPSQVRSWLVAIAANEARQQRRKARRSMVVDISHALDRAGGSDPASDSDLVDLGRALRGLSADDRRLLALRFVAGFDSSEIAKQLGISASGVRSRLARLIDRLRAELGHGGGATK